MLGWPSGRYLDELAALIDRTARPGQPVGIIVATTYGHPGAGLYYRYRLRPDVARMIEQPDVERAGRLLTQPGQRGPTVLVLVSPRDAQLPPAAAARLAPLWSWVVEGESPQSITLWAPRPEAQEMPGSLQ